MWIDVDVALDTFLSHVGPRVTAHPLPLTLWTLVFAKASLLALVGGQAFSFGSGLQRTKPYQLNPLSKGFFLPCRAVSFRRRITLIIFHQ